MPEWIQEFAKLAEGRATRSTVMQPLLWMLAVIVMALVGAKVTDAPAWTYVGFFVVFVAVSVVVLIVFLKLVFTKPELLRSEKFHIRKMELESSIGDSVRGVIDVREPRVQLPEAVDGTDS